MKRLRSLLAFAALLLLLSTACHEVVVEPGPGTLIVNASTTGTSLDPDGYTITVDGALTATIATNGTSSFPDLAFGMHTVVLTGLAMNCTVADANPRTIAVSGGQTTETTFDIACTPAGALTITTATAGDTIDSNGYALTVDGLLTYEMDVNATLNVQGLVLGEHDIELGQVAANCTVGGAATRTITIGLDATTRTTYDVTCVAALLDHIAFTAERDGNQEIYVMNTVGVGQVNLTNHPAPDHSPSWSPNGTKIAFVSERDGNAEIYLTGYDGTGAVNLTNHGAADRTPAWSPDGSKIAFSSDRDGNSNIFVMNSDGSNLQRITTDPAPDESPTWSANGLRIAFATERDGNWEIYTVGADGSNLARLTNDPATERTPAWSPGGQQITFASDSDGQWESYTMSTDGSGPANQTNDPGTDITPAWSRDGTKIAFATDRDGDLEIYVLAVGRPGIVKLTDESTVDLAPSWAPAK
jgi:hypothetical protein